jgi:RsiW-degrading membrane proteinase PrsW (M82 family)
VYLTSRFAPKIDGVTNPYLTGLAEALVTAALPEELSRFALIILAMVFTRQTAEPTRGMAFGGIISAGFAASESLLGALGGETVINLCIGRTLAAVGHCCDGIIMGCFLGVAELRPQQRRFYRIAAFGVPVLLHSLYDFGIMTEVPGADVTLEDELPPWPALVLTGLSFTAWIVELAWAFLIIRRRRGFLRGLSTGEV